jgi:hypothetical protein
MSLLASRIRRRWTAAQNAATTLPSGTLVYITDTPGVAVHNGETPGGLVISGGGGGGGGSVAWADITGKPSTFTPATHTHAAADITSGVFDIARLATGTPDGTKFIRDDGVLASPAPEHGKLIVTNPAGATTGGSSSWAIRIGGSDVTLGSSLGATDLGTYITAPAPGSSKTAWFMLGSATGLTVRYKAVGNPPNADWYPSYSWAQGARPVITITLLDAAWDGSIIT